MNHLTVRECILLAPSRSLPMVQNPSELVARERSRGTGPSHARDPFRSVRRPSLFEEYPSWHAM